MQSCWINCLKNHVETRRCFSVDTLSWDVVCVYREPYSLSWCDPCIECNVKFCFCRSNRPEDCNFIKKETLAQVFSCEICEISKKFWWLLLHLEGGYLLNSLSYRNQSIDLLGKSMDWFLCDSGLRHERVKHWNIEVSTTIIKHICLNIDEHLTGE